MFFLRGSRGDVGATSQKGFGARVNNLAHVLMKSGGAIGGFKSKDLKTLLASYKNVLVQASTKLAAAALILEGAMNDISKLIPDAIAADAAMTLLA